MEKLPAFITTSKRTFDLYVRSYLNVLPFLLLGAFCEYAFFRFFASRGHENAYSGALLEFLINTLVYVMVIYGVYMTHVKNFNVMEVVVKSLKRFFPFLTAVIILILPMLLFIIIATIVMMGMGIDPAQLANDASNDPSNKNLVSGFLIFISLVYILYGLIMIYFWPSTLLIIGKDMGPISGLKASWHLVRGYWLTTFIIVFAYTFLVLIIYYLLSLFLSEVLLRTLSTLIFTSFGASLLVIVVERLEQTKNTAVNLVDTTRL